MSSINVSRPNVDIRHLSGRSTGTPDMRIQLNENILKNTEDYIVGVESLSCPMSHTRSLDVEYPELIYIRRRNAGQDITVADRVVINSTTTDMNNDWRQGGPVLSVFSTTRIAIHCISV